MIIMNSNYHYSTHQFPPFSIDLNQDHQHYLNPHNYFNTTTTTTTNSSPSSSSSSPLPYHIFITPPPSTHRATEDTDPTTHGHQLVATAQDFSSWGPPPTSFHQYQPPLHLQTMYDHEMVEVDDHNRWGDGAVPLESNDKMEKETVATKLRIMKKNKEKKKLTIKTNNIINNNNNPSNVNDVPSPSTLQPAAAPNNNNNGSNSPTAVRVCSDCNTTKTPLWRSGPQGPKSLCNACGIRQRKARRAMAAAAAAAAAIAEGGDIAKIAQPPTMIKLKTSSSSPCKMIGEWTTSNKEKKKRKRNNNNNNNNNNNDNLGSSNNSHLPLKKRGKFSVPRKMITSSSNTISDNNNSNKLCFEELAAIFNNNYSFQRVFPQDEKEAAILLMALSYGLLHT
ncbi:Putative GATA transcription factor 22 [Linum perenne]